MPRITINEVNSTQSRASDTTSALRIALIGTANKGPISEPILIDTYADFLAVFGATAPANYPYGYYAAKECLYAGNPIIYTRLADDSIATYAEYILPNVCELINSGGTKGTYANGHKVKFTQSTSDTDVYTVVVTDAGDNIIETGTITTYGTNCTPTAAEIAGIEEGYGTHEVGTIGGVLIKQAFQAVTVDETTTYNGVSLNVEALINGAALTGGANGDNFDDATVVGHIILGQTGTITGMPYILTQLADDSVYNYILIAAPGIGHLNTTSSDTTVYLWQTLSDLCNGTSICGTSYENSDARLCVVDSNPSTTSYTEVLSGLGKNTTSSTAELQTAFFYPWYTGSVINQSGVYELPPTVAYLRAFAVSQSDGYPCYPIAGPGFGSITRIADVDERLGRSLCEKVTDLGINPISYHRNLGYFFDGNVIYNPMGTTRTYQQLSIRQTINYIKQRLNEICYSLSYGLNVPIIRTQFQGLAVALLERLKTSNFVYGYSVTVHDTQEDYSEGRISATIKVFPTSALEEFVIDLTIVNTEDAL